MIFKYLCCSEQTILTFGANYPHRGTSTQILGPCLVVDLAKMQGKNLTIKQDMAYLGNGENQRHINSVFDC